MAGGAATFCFGAGVFVGAFAGAFAGALGAWAFRGAFFPWCPDGLDGFVAGFIFLETAEDFPCGFFGAAFGSGFFVAFGFDANRAWPWDDLDLVFKQLCRWSLSLKGPRNIRHTDFKVKD